jgi:hypothetical protein
MPSFLLWMRNKQAICRIFCTFIFRELHNTTINTNYTTIVFSRQIHASHCHHHGLQPNRTTDKSCASNSLWSKVRKLLFVMAGIAVVFGKYYKGVNSHVSYFDITILVFQI